jgi:hypothetical protein
MKIRKFLFPWAAAGLMLAGCNSSSPSPSASAAPAKAPPAGFTPLSENNPSVQDEERLDDIISPLLLYFQANGQLPAQLDDLHNVDSNLNLAAPSGKEFAYIPGGAALPDGSLILLVYDPIALPNGVRWGIVTQSLHPTGTLIFTPQRIPDSQFQQFMAAVQQH